ncbi:uncharacterized protein N7506_005225 [Penicillium brevicompactum]|uniref:uncharacterized protein n=1 Tax=Penicillium brevicompactum TaxID=5074 RepID=UPI002541B351|nr:uncharacterized protein N7506_005225 [Penicillium brevicompactum]KAJ5337203.1 hypothetical protein N7506_005225 [Penicillium brevicompactum]
MKDASQKAAHGMTQGFTDNVIAPIIGDIHSVYSTITPTKKPLDEREGQPLKEPSSSLPMLQMKCRYLDQRYKWIIKQIE